MFEQEEALNICWRLKALDQESFILKQLSYKNVKASHLNITINLSLEKRGQICKKMIKLSVESNAG